MHNINPINKSKKVNPSANKLQIVSFVGLYAQKRLAQASRFLISPVIRSSLRTAENPCRQG